MVLYILAFGIISVTQTIHLISKQPPDQRGLDNIGCITYDNVHGILHEINYWVDYYYLGPAENGIKAWEWRPLDLSGVKRRGSNSCRFEKKNISCIWSKSIR